MTEEKKPTEKTLEMRVAAIEDFLAKRQVTEEEMRTFEKVANLLYGPTHLCHQPQPQPQPQQAAARRAFADDLSAFSQGIQDALAARGITGSLVSAMFNGTPIEEGAQS